MRSCAACGAELPPPRRGGQRKRCEACSPTRRRPTATTPAPAKKTTAKKAAASKTTTKRPPAKKPAAKKAPAKKTSARKQPAKVVPLRDDPEPPHTITEATRRQLAEVGREHSPMGMTALVLAGKLDRGEDSGSGMAALARQLAATIQEATRDAKQAASPLDELRARRAAKKAN